MRILFVLMMMISSSIFAAEKNNQVTLSFDKLPVLDLINAVYGDIFQVNYSIDSALVDRADLITVHLRDSNNNQVSDYMVAMLDRLGIVIEDCSNYLLFKPKRENFGKETFLYRPRYRPASYLMDLVGGLFPKGRFSQQPETVMGTGNVPSSSASNPMGMVDSKSLPAGSSGDVAASHKDVDAFIFEGVKEDVDRLKSLLALVDTPVGEVQITAIVYEVGSSFKEGSAKGLALNILGGKFGISFGKLGSIGESAFIKTASIDAVLSALSSDARFRVISAPSIRVKSGAHGLISVGSDVPVLDSVSYDSTGKAVQSVKMMSSGVIFDLKPSVTEAGVDLVVKQQISNFVPTTTGVNSTPTLIKREISTVVGTSHNEIVVLGGLAESKLNQSITGLPFLPTWMFSSGSEDTKSEILLFLHVQKLDQKI